jgi:hypothetical protein
MSAAVRYDIIADRNVALVDYFTRVGEDWSAATFAMQVRPVPDTTDTPILDLVGGDGLILQYAGTDTIANHIAALRLPRSIKTIENPATGANYADADSVVVSILLLIVAPAGMSSPTIPYPPERGNDWVGAYDLLIDVDGVTKAFYGEFVVRATSTIP